MGSGKVHPSMQGIPNMRMLMVLSMLATLSLSVSSQAATEAVVTPEQQYADDAYARGDYPAAMKQYLALAKEGDTFRPVPCFLHVP